MASHQRRLLHTFLLTLPLLAACGGSNGTPQSSSQGTPTASVPASGSEPTPTPSPSPFAIATAFTSPIYGYTVTLPAGWTVVAATSAWDGSSAVGHDDPIVDQLVGPEVTGRCTLVFSCGPIAWAYAGPASQDLAAYVKSTDAAMARDHPCPLLPERKEQITVGGQPALLETRHCPEDETGLLVLEAITLRNGSAYSFYLQDPSKDRGADPANRKDFLALLKTVRLPG